MNERTAENKFLVAACAFAVLLNCWLIYRPPSDTAVEWLLLGRGLLAGKLPYRDYFLHVGPASGYILGFFFALFKPHLLTATFVFLGTNLLTMLGVYRLLRSENRNQALLAAAITGIAMPFFGGAEMFSECFAAFFGVWGFVFMRGGSRKSFVAGTLFFLAAFLVKQTGLAYIGAWGLGELLQRRNIKAVLAASGLFLGGFGLVSAYFWTKGLLNIFFYEFFLINFVKPPSTQHGYLLNFVFGLAPWLFLLTVAGLNKNRWDLLIVLAGISLQCLLVPHYHYFLMAIPFAAIFAGNGLYRIRNNRVAMALTVLFLLPTVGRVGLAAMRPFGMPERVATLVKKTPFVIGSTYADSIFIDLKNAEKVRPFVPQTNAFYTDYPLYYFYLGIDPAWKNDVFDKKSWLADPRFASIDTILTYQHRDFKSHGARTERPDFVGQDFEEQMIPFEAGQLNWMAVYHRSAK